MGKRKLLLWINKYKSHLALVMLLLPLTLHASFIESTMGTAVVNDATAVYYNPAALVLLKTPQMIVLNSVGYSSTQFTGQFTQSNTEFTLFGNSITKNNYYLPSFYIAIPAKNKFTIGFAVLSNFLNKDLDGSSILRYAQSSSSIQNIDYVPALEVKVNQFLALGAALNFSYADFLLKPTIGFPSLNIPDTQSRNECNGKGTGYDVGLLLKPSKATTIGFNYRSSITYRLSGKSILEGDPQLISNHYGFTFWTPARSVLSIHQSLTDKLGVVGTIHRIQWSIFDDINIHGIATQIGPRRAIVDATVPHHLHDTWLLTLGGQYQVTPRWIIRLASSYNQSPGNGKLQIVNGDSFILGSSVAYKISKNISIDGGYAHAYILNENIDIKTPRNQIEGVTKGDVDVFSLKLTFSL
ncbi:MAG: outer membrane protein transport protein [Gammaproteobacteria bacterium]|nr:outer membrane protein transport protein [Gammaproteobacteria bacterium]